MTLPLIPTAAAFAALLTLLYKFVVYPAFLSPLSKVPSAHWSCSISPLWILYHRLHQHDTPTIEHLHKKLKSPVLRLAPSELSVNCVSGGLRTIYSGGFEKGNWYSNVFSNYGVQPMFAMEAHDPHSKRKRIVSNVYAKSTLQTSQPLHEQTNIIINDRLRPRILQGKKAAAGDGGGVEFYDIFCAVTMDFVSAYIFGLGNGTDFLMDDQEGGIRLFHDFKARQKYTFWPQECPNFTRFLAKLGLKWLIVPTWVDGANQEIESWLMSMCEKAEQTRELGEAAKQQDVPTVYKQLHDGLRKDDTKTRNEPRSGAGEEELKIEIASELLDHTLAGFDTSSITLTWLAWQLSKTSNKKWQDALRKEIATLEDSLDAKAIDTLPVLHAILMETLRLHAAIPGQQPRITPSTTLTTLGDPEAGTVYTDLPPNTRVQSQAYSLHRNSEVFPEPNSWLPDRWLNASSYTPKTADELREMTRHFWAFGSGGRMCVGSNLAMLDMKATIVGVWGRFQTSIVDDEGMVPNGGYMAEPLGVGKGGVKGIGGKYADGEMRRFLRLKVEEL